MCNILRNSVIWISGKGRELERKTELGWPKSCSVSCRKELTLSGTAKKYSEDRKIDPLTWQHGNHQ